VLAGTVSERDVGERLDDRQLITVVHLARGISSAAGKGPKRPQAITLDCLSAWEDLPKGDVSSDLESGASRDRTGDLLLAKSPLRPLTRCRTTSITEIPDDFGPSNRSHVATVCRNHLLPTCSLTVWASTHVNITTPQDTAGVGATGRTRPGAEGAGPLAQTRRRLTAHAG
jgi:hypothetical protein